MHNIQENRVLNIIKYSLPILTIIVSSIFILFIVINNVSEFQEESRKIKEEFISSQKTLVKNEVNKVYKQIETEYKVTKDALKQSLVERVNEAYNIAMNIYKENKTTKSKDQIIKMIKDSLREITFNSGRGYYYMNDLEANSILYPPNKDFEGRNFYNVKDPSGKYITRETIKLINEVNEGFISFLWHKPSDGLNYYEKIAYNKKFDPYDIYIGTGEYLRDFEEDVKKDFLKRVQDLTYGLNGYIFIINYKGDYLSHVKKVYVGLNRINLVDKNGFLITKELINSAKKGEGFIKYIGTIMPQTGKPAMKTTYSKGFTPWNWAIASGFYDDEINSIIREKEKQLNEKNRSYIINILLIASIIAIILFIISIYVSKVLEKYFINYRKKIYEEMQKNKDKDSILAQQAKMAAMGEMLENIAHQWRQPLSVITTSASGLQLNKELGILTDEIQNDSLEVILDNAKHLSQTIDDFRDFFSTKNQKEQFDLEETFDKTIKLIHAKLKQNYVELELNTKSVILSGHENMLIQVLINLINNSLDAFKVKKVENKKIFFNIYMENDSVIIDYKDNAGGIDESILNRIFEPYFTTKHQYNGTGIGLYMSQEIILKQMNGKIDVKNININEEKGIEFIISLPLIENKEGE